MAGFVAGRLDSWVTLKVDSLLQYLLMKEEAEKVRPGTEADPRAERFIWEGDSTTIRLVSAFDLS